MKLSYSNKSILSILLLSLFILACAEENKNETTTQPSIAKTNPNPFPFYKNIEIKPGLNFEILSWGKGVDTIGGYLILMSDSVRNNYKSIAVERKGVIVDAWNMDLDNDGNPELYIQYKVRKNENDLNVYEFANNSFDKINFPGLGAQLKDEYEGEDQFFIKNGDLLRTVPLIKIDSGKKTTLVKTIQYNLRGNSFSASEVK